MFKFILSLFFVYNSLSQEICSELQNAVIHKCNSNCQNCDFNVANIILNNCLNDNGDIAYNNLCHESNTICDISYTDCNDDYVCPKITEVTQCGDGGIDGYTTYRLSLITKDNVRNIYAIYGDDDDDYSPMIIPPAYQGNTVFNNNIGGIMPEIIRIDSDSAFDSWLTIGIVDGDRNNELSSVGIDFNSWTENTGITTTNGAVYVSNPENILSQNDEYIVAQITIPNDSTYNVRLNVQGKTTCDDCDRDGRTWKREGIMFHITPPVVNNPIQIPNNCKKWFDGCNSCEVNNGVLGSCTRLLCFTEDTPYCLKFQTSGH